MTAIKKVLLVSANPVGTVPLRLQAEQRMIEHALKHSDVFVRTLPAATVDDLKQALLEEPYQIVHVSSHGNRARRLMLEDKSGNKHQVPPKALADEFKAYRASVQCVVLNACYSLSQGRRIALGVPFTIAMRGSILDYVSMYFSRAFYEAIASGHDPTAAFDRGVNAVKLQSPRTRSMPRLMKAKTKGLPSPTSEITVHVESTRTGKRCDVRIARNAAVHALAREAQRALELPDGADARAFRFPLRWTLVDVRATDRYQAFNSPERQRLRAIVSTSSGLAPSYSGSDSLLDLGVEEGTVFNIYASEDVALTDARGVAVAAAARSMDFPVLPPQL